MSSKRLEAWLETPRNYKALAPDDYLDVGIHKGDLLITDDQIDFAPGQIAVLVEWDGEMVLVGEINAEAGRLYIQSPNGVRMPVDAPSCLSWVISGVVRPANPPEG